MKFVFSILHMIPSNSYSENEKLQVHFHTKSFIIIVVEDDHDDTEFICDALKQVAPLALVQCFPNAIQASDYLKEFPADHTPALFILDYNLPITNGLELLKVIHGNPKFQAIPKVMYTHSDRLKDREQCMAAGATAYIKKSNSFDKIKDDVLQMISLCYRYN